MKKWEAQLGPLKGTQLVGYHDTYNYLYRRYGLVAVDMLEKTPGIPPSPKHLSQVIQSVKTHQVRVVVHETYQDKTPSQMVASRGGARLLVLPVFTGGLPGTDTYIQLMDTLIRRLTEGLNQGAENP